MIPREKSQWLGLNYWIIVLGLLSYIYKKNKQKSIKLKNFASQINSQKTVTKKIHLAFVQLMKHKYKKKLTEKVYLETLLNQLSKEIALEQQCRDLFK